MSDTASHKTVNCPLCCKLGLPWKLKAFQLNFEEAAYLCENPQCPYPIGTNDSAATWIVKRKVTDVVARRRRKRNDSCETTSQISGSSSLQSVPSRASSRSAICHLSSTQTSPASSVSSIPNAPRVDRGYSSSTNSNSTSNAGGYRLSSAMDLEHFRHPSACSVDLQPADSDDMGDLFNSLGLGLFMPEPSSLGHKEIEQQNEGLLFDPTPQEMGSVAMFPLQSDLEGRLSGRGSLFDPPENQGTEALEAPSPLDLPRICPGRTQKSIETHSAVVCDLAESRPDTTARGVAENIVDHTVSAPKSCEATSEITNCNSLVTGDSKQLEAPIENSAIKDSEQMTNLASTNGLKTQAKIGITNGVGVVFEPTSDQIEVGKRITRMVDVSNDKLQEISEKDQSAEENSREVADTCPNGSAEQHYGLTDPSPMFVNSEPTVAKSPPSVESIVHTADPCDPSSQFEIDFNTLVLNSQEGNAHDSSDIDFEDFFDSVEGLDTSEEGQSQSLFSPDPLAASVTSSAPHVAPQLTANSDYVPEKLGSAEATWDIVGFQSATVSSVREPMQTVSQSIAAADTPKSVLESQNHSQSSLKNLTKKVLASKKKRVISMEENQLRKVIKPMKKGQAPAIVSVAQYVGKVCIAQKDGQQKVVPTYHQNPTYQASPRPTTLSLPVLTAPPSHSRCEEEEGEDREMLLFSSTVDVDVCGTKLGMFTPRGSGRNTPVMDFKDEVMSVTSGASSTFGRQGRSNPLQPETSTDELLDVYRGAFSALNEDSGVPHENSRAPGGYTKFHQNHERTLEFKALPNTPHPENTEPPAFVVKREPEVKPEPPVRKRKFTFNKKCRHTASDALVGGKVGGIRTKAPQLPKQYRLGPKVSKRPNIPMYVENLSVPTKTITSPEVALTCRDPVARFFSVPGIMGPAAKRQLLDPMTSKSKNAQTKWTSKNLLNKMLTGGF